LGAVGIGLLSKRIGLALLASMLAFSPCATAQDGQLPAAPSDASFDDDAVIASPVGPRFQFGLDYLNWWLREGRIPAVLTTGPQAAEGMIGKPGTQVLYGEQRLQTRHDDQFGGVRPWLDFWLDDAQTIGVAANAFFLERDSTHFKAISDGSTLLARPYFNADGSPGSYIVAGQTPAGLLSGQFVGYSRIELFGEEANLTANLLRCDSCRLDFLAGARFLQMRDRTDLTASSALAIQASLAGLEDHYRAANAYYGGQAGLRGTWTVGRWSAQLTGEVGLGANEEQLREFGDRVFATPYNRSETPGGLTVPPQGINLSRAAVNLVSSAELNVAYRLTEHVSIVGGYTFLLWDRPLRSGDQIDRIVSSAARPAAPFKSDVFWAQGLNLGVVVAW
jgi:hypothetical protein